MNDNNRTVLNYVIRIAAGAYLVYLAWQLFTGMKTSGLQWYMVLFSGLFLVVGILLILFSIKGLITYKPQAPEPPAENAEQMPEGGADAPAAEETAEAGTEEAVSTEASALLSGTAETNGEAAAEAAGDAAPVKLPDTKNIQERLKALNEADGLELEEVAAEGDADADDSGAGDASSEESPDAGKDAASFKENTP